MSDNNFQYAVFPAEWTAKMRDAAQSFQYDAALANNTWRMDTHARQDSAELAFVARQLEFMRPGLYEVKYPQLKAAGLFPYNNGVDTGSEQYTVTLVDQVGEVKVSRDMSTATPMVEVLTSQGSIGIFSMRLGYEYSLQEARNATFARVPLLPKKAMATREQMERKLDDIAFVGEANTGVKGALTLTGTDTYTVPADGTGASTLFSTKASDDVIRDLNGPVNQVVANTKEIEIPDTMILPLSIRNQLATRRVGDGTSQTILSFFTSNSPFITQVETTYKAESNSAWTGKRGMAYKKDPARLEMIVPQPFEQMAPQYDGFMVRTLCHMRTAGMACYLPKSVCYFDNI